MPPEWEKSGVGKVFVLVSLKYTDGFYNLKKQSEILAVGKWDATVCAQPSLHCSALQ